MKMTVSISVVVIAFFMLVSPLASQQTTSSSALITTTAADAKPIEVDDRAPVAVPEPSEKAIRFHRSGNVLWVVATVWSFLVPLLILTTGLSARIRNFAARLARNNWFFTIAIYIIVFTLLVFILDLPMTFYSDYLRPHAYGLSNLTIHKWLGDTGKALLIGLIVAPLITWVPFLLLRKSPHRWWLYSGLLAVPFIILILFISPIWIDPLFNEFGPMKNKDLEMKILDLAERSGIEGGRVFEVAKSVDTKTVNAYVNGFGATKRIVLWDTIVQKLSERELLFVMGHEMGHYVLGHIRILIAVASLLVIFGLWVVHRTARRLIDRFGDRWGFHELSDVASYPLIILLFSVATFALTPALLALTRYNEHEADRFGLEITRDNRAAATAFVTLQEENLAIPRPGLLYKLWRSSHPPIGERIDFFNSYRPWESGGALKYQEHFGQGDR